LYSRILDLPLNQGMELWVLHTRKEFTACQNNLLPIYQLRDRA
jgi:hypothetical protein